MEYFNQSQTDWRIAQCCQWHDKALAKRYNIGTTTKTYALKEGGKERVQSKALSNVNKLVDALENYFPHQPVNLRAFRISSDYFLVIHWTSLMSGMMRLGRAKRDSSKGRQSG